MKRALIIVGHNYALKGEKCVITGPAVQEIRLTKSGGKRFAWLFPATVGEETIKVESRQLASTWDEDEARLRHDVAATEEDARLYRAWSDMSPRLFDLDVFDTVYRDRQGGSDYLQRKVEGRRSFYLSLEQAGILREALAAKEDAE